MKPTITTDSATISTTEYFMVADGTAASYQTEDADVEFWWDVNAVAAGDEFLFQVYDKVNAGTARARWYQRVTGAYPLLVSSPRMTLCEGWEASVTKVTGTDRAIAWSIRKFTEGETVVTGSISAGAITAAAIATGAIDADAIADNAIDAGAIASDAITAAKIATGAITAAKFAADAITSTVVADSTITAAKLATGAITAAKFAAGAIDAAAIATDAIDADALAANAVTEIQSGLATSANQATIISATDTLEASAATIAAAVDTLEASAAAIEIDTQDIQGRLPAALVGGRIDASVGAMAADVLTAAALAADAVTEIVAGVFAYAHETSRTFKGLARRLDAFIAGKATGLVGTSAVFYRSDASTAAITATQSVDNGTRDAATVAGD